MLSRHICALQQVTWMLFPVSKDGASPGAQKAFSKLKVVRMLYPNEFRAKLKELADAKGLTAPLHLGHRDYLQFTNPAASQVYEALSDEKKESVMSWKTMWNKVGQELEDSLKP